METEDKKIKSDKMKIAIILGTRPEIIKMSPIIYECEKKNIDYFVIHTGQHYDYLMDKLFFEELDLKPMVINLNVGSGKHGEVTGKMLIEVEKTLIEHKPDVVFVEGDTNTVLAGSLAAVKLHIKVGHVEAGLRSYFKMMPEEHNRIVADHISDFLFAPTEDAQKILLSENLTKNVIVTGNTIVDAVFRNLELAKKSDILSKLNIQKENYFLITAHREENVDNKERLLNILNGLKKISTEFKLLVVFPIHPRTKKRLKEFNIEFDLIADENIKLINPVGFLDFLTLEANAKLILTDSGGVQEEACILGTPCVTLRDNTERPETIKVGANVLSGCSSEKIFDCVTKMLAKDKNWANPFGDGKAAERIINFILDKC